MNRKRLRQFIAAPQTFIPRQSYEAFVSFLEGFDFASNRSALGGFQEWLIKKYRVPKNFHYAASVLDLMGLPWDHTRTPEQEEAAIERLRVLLEEFFEETKGQRSI